MSVLFGDFIERCRICRTYMSISVTRQMFGLSGANNSRFNCAALGPVLGRPKPTLKELNQGRIGSEAVGNIVNLHAGNLG